MRERRAMVVLVAVLAGASTVPARADVVGNIGASSLGASANGMDLVAEIQAAAARLGLDPLLLAAIAYHESELRPLALNVAGEPIFPSSIDEAIDVIHSHGEDYEHGRMDVGALQINTRWLQRVNAAGPLQLAPEDLLDPGVAATMGAAVLKHELDATSGDVWRAVARYHSGPERPDNIERGRAYAAAVRRAYEDLRARVAGRPLVEGPPLAPPTAGGPS